MEDNKIGRKDGTKENGRIRWIDGRKDEKTKRAGRSLRKDG